VFVHALGILSYMSITVFTYRLNISLVYIIGVRGGGHNGPNSELFALIHMFFQVTSLIISSRNAASVIYYRYQFVVSIALTTFRIMKFSWQKNRSIVPGTRGTMGHWVGHNKTFLILLHLIFIYLILQINKSILSDLQQNSCFGCTVCATRIITQFYGAIIITV